jgi:hypothetical protein
MSHVLVTIHVFVAHIKHAPGIIDRVFQSTFSR